MLIDNTISSGQNGVWLCNTGDTILINTPSYQNGVTDPVVTCASGGS